MKELLLSLRELLATDAHTKLNYCTFLFMNHFFKTEVTAECHRVYRKLAALCPAAGFREVIGLKMNENKAAH